MINIRNLIRSYEGVIEFNCCFDILVGIILKFPIMLLLSLIMSCKAMKPEETRSPDNVAVIENHQATNIYDRALKFTIVQVWPPDKDTDLRLIFGFIEKGPITKGSAELTAYALNSHLGSYSNIRVYLWDDEIDAQIYSKKLADEFSTFNKHLRIIYGVNRQRCVEYIDYYPDKYNYPEKKDSINLICKRPPPVIEKRK